MPCGNFNPRSLTGATCAGEYKPLQHGISIHAPLRERLYPINASRLYIFISIHAPLRERRCRAGRAYKGMDFNPRSLTGATPYSRSASPAHRFQSTLPYGSDTTVFALSPTFIVISIHAPLRERRQVQQPMCRQPAISIHAPLRERRIKTNYFSINLSQAFFANRLNSNTQEFYFDVRKLLVSHSSPGCEPKLNYMFHITSHRIILHYFSSCQSICK